MVYLETKVNLLVYPNYAEIDLTAIDPYTCYSFKAIREQCFEQGLDF